MPPTLANRSLTLALWAWRVLIIGGAVTFLYVVGVGGKPFQQILLLFFIYPLAGVAAGCAGVGLVLGLVVLGTRRRERHALAKASVGVLLNVLALVILALAKVKLVGK